MRSKGFLFLSGGLGAGSCLTCFRRESAALGSIASVRGRPRLIRLGVAIGRCNSACLEHVAPCVRVDVSRGRRGEACDVSRRRASFGVADAGNCVRQPKLLDFVALCEKTAVSAHVHV